MRAVRGGAGTGPWFGCTWARPPMMRWAMGARPGSEPPPLPFREVTGRSEMTCPQILCAPHGGGAGQRRDREPALRAPGALGSTLPERAGSLSDAGTVRTDAVPAAGGPGAFGPILDQVREQRASYLLDNTQMPVERVAEALGFAETASFFRAFKRWKGMSPLRFRHRAAT
jgi:hypothetical protein